MVLKDRAAEKRSELASLPDLGHQVYQAEIHERPMKSAFPLGGGGKVGFSAVVQQARARGKYRVKRNAGSLQSDSSQKGDIEVVAPSRAVEVGGIQGFDRIECPKRAPPFSGFFLLLFVLFR